MAASRSRKNSCGAMALASSPSRSLGTATWSWPATPNPESENDVTYYLPLYRQTVATLGFFPTYVTADAAFDAWYIYAHSCTPWRDRGDLAEVGMDTPSLPETPMACHAVPRA